MIYKYLSILFFILINFIYLNSCTPAGVIATSGSTAAVIASSDRSVGEAVDDATIKMKISEKYFRSKSGLLLDVDISVRIGTVLLTGIVKNQDIRIEAIKYAWEIEGVKEVINEIEIGNEQELMDYAKDLWISTQVRAKTLKTLGLDVITYNFETINGKVHVIGVSKDKNEPEQIIDVIKTIKGVNEIVNHIIYIEE